MFEDCSELHMILPVEELNLQFARYVLYDENIKGIIMRIVARVNGYVDSPINEDNVEKLKFAIFDFLRELYKVAKVASIDDNLLMGESKEILVNIVLDLIEEFEVDLNDFEIADKWRIVADIIWEYFLETFERHGALGFIAIIPHHGKLDDYSADEQSVWLMWIFMISICGIVVGFILASLFLGCACLTVCQRRTEVKSEDSEKVELKKFKGTVVDSSTICKEPSVDFV